jgi:hypothetical protein
MPGTPSAKTRFALLPGHDDVYVAMLLIEPKRQLFFSPDMTGPNNCQLSPWNFII